MILKIIIFIINQEEYLPKTGGYDEAKELTTLAALHESRPS